MTNLKPLVIVGAGPHGLELWDIVRDINRAKPTFKVIGFVDDGSVNQEKLAVRGVPLLGPIEALADLDAMYVLGIGNPVARASVGRRVEQFGLETATLIHPTVAQRSFVKIGRGSIIMTYSSLSYDVVIGEHVVVHTLTAIGHEVVIGNFSSVSSRSCLSGRVKVGERVLIGAGTAVVPNVAIQDDSIIGAGSAVTKDIPSGVTAVGVPARVIRSHETRL
jgi:sugar O-acyltransferase (sialic acid O-acetyltransferase NeuD family)